MPEILPSIGTTEHPFPAWALKPKKDIEEICRSVRKTQHEFFTELLPAIVQTASVARKTVAKNGNTLKNPILPDDFLDISNGTLQLNARLLMGCTTGMCDMDVEDRLEELQGWTIENGWERILTMKEYTETTFEKLRDLIKKHNQPTNA